MPYKRFIPLVTTLVYAIPTFADLFGTENHFTIAVVDFEINQLSNANRNGDQKIIEVVVIRRKGSGHKYFRGCFIDLDIDCIEYNIW